MGLMSVLAVAALNKTDALDPYWNFFNSTLLFPFGLIHEIPSQPFFVSLKGNPDFEVLCCSVDSGMSSLVGNGNSSVILSILLPRDNHSMGTGGLLRA